MFNNCKWLPATIPMNRNETSVDYLSRLYTVFVNDFNLSHPQFLGKDVIYDTNLPLVNGREEAFYHLTTVDDHSTYIQHREIDYARSERLPWIRKVIENYKCADGCCDGIKVWKNKRRIKILFEKEKYFIVLQKHSKNFHLVTAFYINWPHELEKLKKEYECYKDVKI